MKEHAAGVWARRLLAVIRLTNGLLGLLAPQILIRRLATDPAVDKSAFYPFRMFGIRTVVLGVDLLTMREEQLARADATAIIIHSADTISAAVGGIRGDVPIKVARMTTTISAINTILAIIAWTTRRRR